MIRSSLVRKLPYLSIASLIAGCVASSVPPGLEDDVELSGDGKSDSSASWLDSGTLRMGILSQTSFEVGMRRVFPFYVGADSHHTVKVRVSAGSETSELQLAVLGPLHNGHRETIAYDGYDQHSRHPTVSTALRESGQYLVVLATKDRAFAADEVRLVAECMGGGCDRADALISPRFGALSTSRQVSLTINPALDDQDVEIWARLGPWREPAKVASGRTVGRTATISIPNSVEEGSDLLIKLGNNLDDGTKTRLWTAPGAGFKLDTLSMSDFGNRIWISGVLPYFEGQVIIPLYDETTNRMLTSTAGTVDFPGMVGNGLNAVDADFSIPLDAYALPHERDILSVGYETEAPSYKRVLCFRYCNSLAAESSCVTERVKCPTTPPSNL